MHFWACSLMHISGNPLPKKIYARKKDISNNEKRQLSDDFLKLNSSAFNCSQNGKTMAKWLPIHWNRLEMESRLHKGVTSWLNSKTLLAVTVVVVFLSLFKWNQNLVETMAKRSNWVRIWVWLGFQWWIEHLGHFQANSFWWMQHEEKHEFCQCSSKIYLFSEDWICIFPKVQPKLDFHSNRSR